MSLKEKENLAETTEPASSDIGEHVGTVSESKLHDQNIITRFNWYMAQMSGETHGIARVPEDERHDDSFLDTATMWVGADMGIAAYALGTIGIPVFGCGIRDSMATIICFTVLGTIPLAAMSCFGPPTGMRQLIVSRYWFGSIGSRICAFLNALTCIGWSCTNTVAAVNSLHVVNHGGLPQYGGILITGLSSLVIALFGYKIVHYYERYAWIPSLFVCLVIAICLGQDGLMDWGTLNSGPAEAASVLSFGGAIYGFAGGWGIFAADYTCYKPKDTNKWKIFFYVLFWGSVGTIAPMLLGAFSAQRILTSPAYAAAYNNPDMGETGGLLWMILVQDKLHGFGQVCMVILALTVISNNVPNLYSFAVAAQAVIPWFRKIPQYLWACVITGAAIGISIPAVKHFDEYLSDFMNIMSYWVSIYYGIVLAEHVVFRRSYDNYRLDVYDSFVRLPFGVAAVFAGCCGVTGAVVGMAQTWWVGPIAKMISTEGGDIGFELCLSFSFIGYILTRWIERIIYPDESYVWGTENAWWRFGFLKFPDIQTPEWAKKIDVRYAYARKHNHPPPGQYVDSPTDFSNTISVYGSRFARNRGVEEQG